MSELGDILIMSEKNGTVSINMSREDLLDLYSGLRGLKFDNSTFAADEVRDLIRRFFSDNKDVKSDPDSSLRFFPNLREY